MIIQVQVMGYIVTNAYFYIDDETKHGFLIDPGAEPEKLLGIIEEKGFTIEKILLTHGHFDHIGAVPRLQQELKVPVIMQQNGRQYAEDPAWNLSSQLPEMITLRDVTYINDNSDVLLQANPAFFLHMVPVPGHTSDGCIYYSVAAKAAFVGDSIFQGSYGRTDLPGGDERQLMQGIVQNILSLPEDTTLLSGHSEPTTVAAERQMPWYQGIL
ncbi:Glyoxylase, beta-lactamase superfamily II [Selenomonas sp. GACV-9]|uniref:MBL fold metallo-hydrolase n=1 Tax=Selenomonas sp. GACV-9 TaxID=3158782 RepID=UPI0008DFD799|nr:Glyoxylase, beta-lactamase superfamily II [Selenomonas ruminantium]